MTDYYSILGVNKEANSSDIKKGYFKQSKLYHPDKNKEPGAKEKFQNITEAYGVLKEEDTKKIYDQYGKEGLQTMREGGGGGHPFQHMFRQGQQGVEIPGFGFVQFGNQQRQRQPKSPNLDAHVSITLEEGFKGTTKEIKLMRTIYNSGNDIVEERPLKFKIQIPAGSAEKVQQVLRGKGHQYKNHLPGDLVLIIERNLFERSESSSIRFLIISSTLLPSKNFSQRELIFSNSDFSGTDAYCLIVTSTSWPCDNLSIIFS